MRELVLGVLQRLAGGPSPRDGSELGSYRLVERLGAGGMGEVWRGEHRLLGRPVAIKLVKPEALRALGDRREEWLRRFEREARATALLQSPHTVRLYDYGRTPAGALFYAMELLEGLDLEDLVDRFGVLGPARTVFILERLCASLAEAHESGLVHRDVKPANVFLSRLGLEHDFVKVLDFGLVSPVGSGDPRITGVNEVLGTPAFVAPEVVEGLRADARADVYAVGCVAYWLLTGTHVFPANGRNAVQVMLDHVGQAPEAPSRRLGRELPRTLEALVMSCLEKRPGCRPDGAVELGRCLRACRIGQGWREGDARSWWSTHLPHLAARERRLATTRRSPVRAA